MELLRREYSPKIRFMRAREAKEFLVQQTAEQASIEGVPLSDLEKRMMYFTETGYCPEDPVGLNEEFERQYDTNEYEAKISGLLKHAYKRVSEEDTEKRKTWDAAIKCLRRGDHYMLVMWDQGPGAWRNSIIGTSIVVAFIGLWLGMRWIASRVAPLDPRIIWAVIAMIALAATVFRAQSAKAMAWVLRNTLGRYWDRKEQED